VCEKLGGACGNVKFNNFCKYVTLKCHKETYQNGQQAKWVPNVSNPCPHSHVKKLDAKGWIKPKQKRNVEVKVECVMQIEQIDGLATNHSLAPLPKEERMQALDD